MLTRVMSYQKDDGWPWTECMDVDESHVYMKDDAWHWSERVNVDESCFTRRMMADWSEHVDVDKSHVLPEGLWLV